MSDSRDVPLGIDLGTTNSGTAFLERGQPVMIANEQGNYIIPSVVSFTDTERLVGDAAAHQAGCNPENTVFEMKRLIGRRSDDLTVVNDSIAWPFRVISDSSKKPQIRVRYAGAEKDFYPENISAMVLSQLKLTAENHLGHAVSKVVITVPAAFNDAQRQATQDAGRMAGFEVLRVINEPTAAALAYGFFNRIEERENRRVLVFDFGGGTFDVSILCMRNKEYEVVRSMGDLHLGGGDIDIRLFQHFQSKLSEMHPGISLTDDTRAVWRLRKACESVKKQLSVEGRGYLEVDNLLAGVDFHACISRAEFEHLCADIFNKTIELTKRCLHEADLRAADIDEVVLVGGSTRIPKVRRLVEECFGAEKVRHSINADEAVALGAVVQASMILGTSDSKCREIVVKERIPISLGINVLGELTSHIIKCNSIIPAKNTKTYVTTEDDQTAILVRVIEGEHENTVDNIELDQFLIEGIPKAPAGEEGIDVTLVVNENCILEVTACVLSTGQSKGIVIKRNRKQFTDEDIHQHLKMEEDMQRRNQLHTQKQKLVMDLQAKAYALQKQPALETLCKDVLRWLDGNGQASDGEIEAKIGELEQIEEARNRTRQELDELITSLRSNAAVREECDEVLRWMQASAKTASEADYRDKIAHLKQLSQNRKSRARDRLETRLRETRDKFLDHEAIQEVCQNTQTWLDENGERADDDDFLDKLDELANAVQNILLEE